LHLIGYLLDYPQTTAGLAGQRVHDGLTREVLRLGRRVPVVVSFLPRRCPQITVVDLTVQCSCYVPYPQASHSATMADDVRRQLVHGQNHVLGLIFREFRVTGAGSHPRPRRLQRAQIQSQIKDR
jgi:hypothetical protein